MYGTKDQKKKPRSTIYSLSQDRKIANEIVNLLQNDLKDIEIGNRPTFTEALKNYSVDGYTNLISFGYASHPKKEYQRKKQQEFNFSRNYFEYIPSTNPSHNLMTSHQRIDVYNSLLVHLPVAFSGNSHYRQEIVLRPYYVGKNQFREFLLIVEWSLNNDADHIVIRIANDSVFPIPDYYKHKDDLIKTQKTQKTQAINGVIDKITKMRDSLEIMPQKMRIILLCGYIRKVYCYISSDIVDTINSYLPPLADVPYVNTTKVPYRRITLEEIICDGVSSALKHSVKYSKSCDSDTINRIGKALKATFKEMKDENAYDSTALEEDINDNDVDNSEFFSILYDKVTLFAAQKSQVEAIVSSKIADYHPNPSCN